MRIVIGGVDTHAATHHALVLDQLGRSRGDESFPATATAYAQMLSWMRRHGQIQSVGVEGCGA